MKSASSRTVYDHQFHVRLAAENTGGFHCNFVGSILLAPLIFSFSTRFWYCSTIASVKIMIQFPLCSPVISQSTRNCCTQMDKRPHLHYISTNSKRPASHAHPSPSSRLNSPVRFHLSFLVQARLITPPASLSSIVDN